MNSFWNRHEESLHVWVSDRDWTTLLDLLLKCIDDGTPATEDVTKAYYDKRAAALLGGLTNNGLSNMLGGPHDACRRYRLVARDQDEAFGSCSERLIDHIPSADDVIGHRLLRILFHEQHVFVSSRMKDDGGPDAIEHVCHPIVVPNVSNDCGEV